MINTFNQTYPNAQHFVHFSKKRKSIQETLHKTINDMENVATTSNDNYDEWIIVQVNTLQSVHCILH
jgi:hypothetical protein